MALIDKYQEITTKIIEQLEAGTVPWRKPWTSSTPRNLFTGKSYRGINTMLLGLTASRYPFFATFKQVKEVGGSVLKGSKGTPIYFMSKYQFPSTVTKQKGGKHNVALITEPHKNAGKEVFIIKQYTVFTVEQMELPDGLLPQLVDPVRDFQPNDTAENVSQKYLELELLEVLTSLNQAAYSPSQDRIYMPPRESFTTEAGYWGTLFHEITHSTGHPERLKREAFELPTFKLAARGKDYGFEELVAELGASFLCAHCGIDNNIEDGQASAYIKSWLRVLKDDPKMVWKAASQAQKAVDFVLSSSAHLEASEGEI